MLIKYTDNYTDDRMILTSSNTNSTTSFCERLFWQWKMSDNEYWLVAVPGDPTPDKSWSVLSERIKGCSACFKYPIPAELKVG